MNDRHKELSRELIAFLDENKSQFHAVAGIARMYEEAGFKKLAEREKFELEEGGSYYVTRNSSSIIGFKIPKSYGRGFNIVSAHSDSPTFKIKNNAEIEIEGLIKLNVEKYGGMLMSSWFDRPLGVAGRVIIKNENRLEERLVNIQRNILLIPNLAIHMNRDVNKGYEFNAQKDVLPIISTAEGGSGILDVVAQELGISKEAVVDMDLFLTNQVRGTIWGANDEFIAANRLDDLQCAYLGAKSLISSENNNSIAMHCIFDNEEVGSLTKQGAAGTFLKDTMKRIVSCFSDDSSEYYRQVASSFMISADNAHSIHPNYTEKADPTNRPLVNKGIVIKYSANQKYTTDAVSASIFKEICKKACVPTQSFVNRSDTQGGSTLGNISASQVSLRTVDIGLAQWAMHSAYESAGVKDSLYLETALRVFFETDIDKELI